jgi:hypothetical protein
MRFDAGTAHRLLGRPDLDRRRCTISKVCCLPLLSMSVDSGSQIELDVKQQVSFTVIGTYTYDLRPIRETLQPI